MVGQEAWGKSESIFQHTPSTTEKPLTMSFKRNKKTCVSLAAPAGHRLSNGSFGAGVIHSEEPSRIGSTSGPWGCGGMKSLETPRSWSNRGETCGFLWVVKSEGRGTSSFIGLPEN